MDIPAGDPIWSPDGSTLVIRPKRDGDAEIYKVNADGAGTSINITKQSGDDSFPSWSPLP